MTTMENHGTHQNAWRINSAPSTYGTFAKIRAGDDSWENDVPPIVADMIKTRELFRGRPATVTA